MRSNKIKDMIRSILPSKARRSARIEKAMLNREVRRSVRQDLHVENLDVDLRREPHFQFMVWDRRGADKLNHFMRWCEAITKGMSTEDALSYVRAILPDSLIGDHAYGHWKCHRQPNAVRNPDYRPYEQREQSFIDSTTFRLRRALMVDPSLHARLNVEIKARTPEDKQWRVLAGAHDVEAFVREINELERRITLELIERIEKQKGGRKAALRVFASVSWRELAIRHEPRHPLGTAAVHMRLSKRCSNFYGISKTLPVVWRASSARCADAASRSGTSRSMRTCSFPSLIQANNSPARQFNSSDVAEYAARLGRVKKRLFLASRAGSSGGTGPLDCPKSTSMPRRASTARLLSNVVLPTES